MENINNIDLGNRIKSKRIELRITQGELASRVQIATSTISRYEKGQIENVKLPIIESIARELKVDSQWLLVGMHQESYAKLVEIALDELKTEKCKQIFSKMTEEEFITWIEMGKVLLKK